jgi:hypothetical protein
MPKYDYSDYELLHSRNVKEFFDALLKDVEGTKGYIDYLIDNNFPVEDKFIKVLKDDSGSSLQFARKMKRRGIVVNKPLIDAIAKNPYASVKYAIDVLSAREQVEKKILNIIFKTPSACLEYLGEIIKGNKVIPVYPEIIDFASKTPSLSYDLCKSLVKNRGYSYEDLDEKLRDSILSDTETAKKFAHFIEPFVKEFPRDLEGLNAGERKAGWSKREEAPKTQQPLNFKDYWKQKNG